MSVYASYLLHAMRVLTLPSVETTSFLPKNVMLTPRLGRYWSQYISYQLRARFVQGDVNHVIDQSYGHIVHSLDPARAVVTFHDAIGLKSPEGENHHALTLVQRYNLSGLRIKDFLAYTGYPPEQKDFLITSGSMVRKDKKGGCGG